jgi:Uma2 family endonuclease
MSTLVAKNQSSAETVVPRLENGDSLTRAEFERRYNAMPGVKKAELIEGIVYMPSPARHQNHGKPQSDIIGWISYYAAHTASVEPSDNATVRLDFDNEPQPDALLRILPERGGQTADSEDGFIVGAPEFVAEIAASSASYDRNQKKDAYRRNGVREYLLWLTEESRLEWWEMRDGEFQQIFEDDDGILRSRVFPGLWLDPRALLNGNLARVFEVVQMGANSEAHREFVASLA